MRTRRGREPARRGKPGIVSFCPECKLAGWHKATCRWANLLQRPSPVPSPARSPTP